VFGGCFNLPSVSEYANSLEWLIKSMPVCEKLNCALCPCVVEESSHFEVQVTMTFSVILSVKLLAAHDEILCLFIISQSWSSLVRRMGLCFLFEPRPVFRLLTRFSHILDFHSKFFIFQNCWACMSKAFA